MAPIRGAENPCHYRNKVISTFAAGPGGKLVSGIYAAGTHKVLPVESCLLQDEVLDTVMQAVRAAASTCRYQPYNDGRRGGARGGEMAFRNYECFPSSQFPQL